MKKMLFILLVAPSFVFAQSDEAVNAFLKSKPGNLGTPILLPQRSSYYVFPEMHDSQGRLKRVFIATITSDSVYHQLFNRYIYTQESLKNWVPTTDSFYYKLMCEYQVDSLPVIDFSKQELVLYSACGQCLAFCHHNDKEDNQSCHRNACDMQEAWYVRDKMKELTVSNKLLE